MRQTPYNEDLIEQARLACLRNLQILDTAADDRLDRITQMAAHHYGVPISLVNMVDEERHWFKSRFGLDAPELPRGGAFCDYTIKEPRVFVVENAEQDPRFTQNPLVKGAAHVRFYAGAAISIDDEHRVGTLCLIDNKPRAFTEPDKAKLEALARSVEVMIASIYQARNTLSSVQTTGEQLQHGG